MAESSAPYARRLDLIRRRYPRGAILRDARKLELRLMSGEDRSAILEFAGSLSDDDLLFLDENIREERVVDGWVEAVRSGRTQTVLAYESAAVVGYGSLHHSNTNWSRHLGEIRLVVGKQHRQQGLGKFLAEEIFALADNLGLQKLTAQMTHDQVGAQAVFRGLGFQAVAILPGFVIAGDGKTRDLMVMAYDLTAGTAPGG